MAIMKQFSAQDYELFKLMKHQEELKAALEHFSYYFCNDKKVSLDFVDDTVAEIPVKNILELMVDEYHEQLFEYSSYDAWNMVFADMDANYRHDVDYLSQIILSR